MTAKIIDEHLRLINIAQTLINYQNLDDMISTTRIIGRDQTDVPFLSSRKPPTRIKTLEFYQPQVMHSNKKGDIYSSLILNRLCGLPRDLKSGL